MIQKFKDFDSEKFKLKSVLEKFEEQEISDSNIDTSSDVKVINDDEYLLKLSKVVLNALKKSGVNDLKPYGLIVYLNGIPGVWFVNNDNLGKSFVIYKKNYVKYISIFNNFKLGEKNTANVTYSSAKAGIVDMLKLAVEDVKPDFINEATSKLDPTLPSTTYGPKHISTVISWSNEMKEYCVNRLNETSSLNSIANEIKSNYKTNPICRQICDSLGGEKSTTVTYAIAIIYDAMNKCFPSLKDVLPEYLKSIKPVVSKSVDDDFDSMDDEEDDEEIRKEFKKQEQEFEESMELIRETTNTFCHYVKQNGYLDNDEKGLFTTRGVYLTGSAGSGKSYAIQQALKENNMRENKDYIDVRNGGTNADELYRMFYKYNGKLILLDDSANVVSGSKRVAFWKAILQTQPKPVKYPRETNNNGFMYSVENKTRQERYFAEIGKKSNDEKLEFFKRKRRELSSKDFSGKELDNYISKLWEEELKDTKALMPDEFLFTGCVIIVGNMSPAELKTTVVKEGGARDWDAIRQRFQPIELDPPYKVIWEKIQKKLREQQKLSSTELPDEMCIIPRDMIDECIDEVNYLLNGGEGPQYIGISWRTIANIGGILHAKNRKLWKRKLKFMMEIS